MALTKRAHFARSSTGQCRARGFSAFLRVSGTDQSSIGAAELSWSVPRTLPRRQPKQLLSQRGQRRRLIMRFFPVAGGVDGEGAGGGAVAPRVDAGLAGRFIVRLGGEHADVLGQTGLIGLVAPVAVEQPRVPDDQIAGLTAQVFDRQAGDVGAAQIGVRFLARYNLWYLFVRAGDTLKTTLRFVGVRQAEHALHARAYRPGERVKIPVNKPLVIPIWPRRRIHVGPIQGDPELFAAKEFTKGLMNTRRLAVVPERLMVVEVGHPGTTVPRRLAVPGFGIMAIHLQKVPNGIHHGVQIGFGRHIRDNNVAVLFPKGVVGCT